MKPLLVAEAAYVLASLAAFPYGGFQSHKRVCINWRANEPKAVRRKRHCSLSMLIPSRTVGTS